MTIEQNPLAAQLAALDGDALLQLLNLRHQLQAEQVAREHGITDQASVDELAAASDKDAMQHRAAELKADAEYQHFYPSDSATDGAEGEPDDAEYRAFFPGSNR